MEALGAAASVIAVLEGAIRVTSAVIEYSIATKNASADRKLLAEESRALARQLERLKNRFTRKDSSSETWLAEHVDLVRQFSRAYDDLLVSLDLDMSSIDVKAPSHRRAIWAVATWTFTKREVYSVLERLARLQLYANTLLLDDQHSLVEKVHDRQEQALTEELRSTIVSWLSPLQMHNVHAAICKRPEAGSGRWFLTSQQFRRWQEGQTRLLWCPGIRK